MTNKIEIYRTDDFEIQVKVQTEKDTVWLSQKQMADLFGKDSDTIGLHLKNIFEEEELSEKSTTEYFSVVQKEGKRSVRRKIKHYNLDGIISVGYRVNSKRGTQFRQWATQRLKDYLVEGYALNRQRLEQLDKIVKVIDQTSQQAELQISEAKGLLQLLSTYTKIFVLLDQFDSNKLEEKNLFRSTIACFASA